MVLLHWRQETWEVNLILIEDFIFYQIWYDCNLRYILVEVSIHISTTW